ncbi:hypothetical protein [Streptomyces formicae]|uniref:Putative integral membrane protein n=1 Tax=Streptomyces formicae TaxID=1616117 RepID=A0A291QKZ5_9ACTN|nr:hypothetical protein [Streptomyces formicae]ATL32238.1 putative integral membrane protein [Streptomyces formicae]
MNAPTWLRAVAWRWRKSPLRRRCDVVEAWTVLLLGAAMVFVAPLAGVLAGAFAYDSAHAEAARQRADRHVVRATLVEDAPPADSFGSRTTYPVEVRWTGPGGAVHTAVARVESGATAGSRTDVWLDARGKGTTAPMGEDVQWGTAIAVGGAGSFVVWMSAGGVWLTVRAVTHRRRMAEWERAWARTGPQWTGSQR